MTILIMTWSGDNECVENVTSALEARGSRVFRLNTDQFPTEVQISARIELDCESVHLKSAEGAVVLSDVQALWHRRIRVARNLPETMDKQLRKASMEESRRTLFGALASEGTFVMDPVSRIRHGEHKQLQLRVARGAGLEIPRTLMSNDPCAVREFAADCGGKIVGKMLSSFAIFEGETEQVVFTNPMGPADLEHLEELRFCPMTFQEHIEKALELRVTIVGEKIFAASIDSQSLEGAKSDWRREGRQLTNMWKPFELPADVERSLLSMMDSLRLNYGAADLILTPEGRYVFLEVNPAGEFFWLERACGLNISEAIADLLLDRVPRRDTTIVPELGTILG